MGENFLANYNVTILDIARVTIGDYVMIGPNTLITTVNHPLSPRKRRGHIGQAKPVTISYHGSPELLEQVLDKHLEVEAMLKEVRPNASAASWALRFVGSLDGVMTILSGISAQEQMEDNLNTFRNFEPLTEQEKQVIQDVVQKMQDMPMIQCTSCLYCCDGCPMSICIPDIFRALNTARLYKKDNRPKMFYNNLIGTGSMRSNSFELSGAFYIFL